MASGSGSDPPQLPRGLIGRTGNPSAKGTRLPSIRGPRDLTLGGVQKKVFTPNIPTRRAKPSESGDGEGSTSKPEDSKPKRGGQGRSGSDRGRDHRGGGRGGGRGRGRGRTNTNVIQTHSLFEQGPAEKAYKPAGGGDSVGAKYGSSGSGSGSSTVKRERSDADTKQVLDHLLRDDFIAGQGGGLDEEDVTLVPVRLPLEVKKEPATTKEEPDFTKVKVKDEPMDTEEGKTPEAPAEKKLDFQPMKADAPTRTCAEMFTNKMKSEEGELMFFQLPDMLPGLPLTTDEEFRGKKPTDKKDTDKEKEEECKQKSCGLGNFGEGLIGKLVVRKSGRVQMMLGNTALDVNMGANCGFLQDLVSVRVNDDHGSASILGHVAENSLVCTPDFETMLEYT